MGHAILSDASFPPFASSTKGLCHCRQADAGRQPRYHYLLPVADVSSRLPEDVLPWTQPEYDFWLDNTWRFARPCGYTMAGDISYEGTVYSAYIVAFRETGASDDYPTLRENYKTVPIYVQSGDGGVKMQFIVEGHLYQVGMMAPPESALTQDVTDYFDGLLLAACRDIIDLYS